jgi:hypothetical protein
MTSNIAHSSPGANANQEKSHVTITKMDFHHPYTPYAIQEEFMGTVYRVLEEGTVGILESPTGTASDLFHTSRDTCNYLFILNDLKTPAGYQDVFQG